MFFTLSASALLGVVTAACGYGWVKDGNIYWPGALMNLCGVLVICSIKYYFIDKNKTK